MNLGRFQIGFKSSVRCSLTMLVALCAFTSSYATWDETRYEYDPGTGDLLKKAYPDGQGALWI